MTALSHTTKVYGSKRAMVYGMLTDPVGGPATYSAGVMIPGIKKVAITGAINIKELRGDNTFLDADAVVERIDVSIDWAKFNFDILAAALGWTAADTGTTPNRITTANVVSPVSLPYFKLDVQGVSVDVIGGDIHFVLPKLKLASFPEMGTNEEDFQLQKVTAVAVPTLADGKWVTVIENETAAVPA